MDNKRILVIEDDLQIRNYITHILSQEHFSYVEAGKGQRALELLKEYKIDLILLDLGLPDMEGIDLIKQFREFLELPIIVVSARDQDLEKTKALDLGADDYVTKPFSTPELLARIRVALRRASKYVNEKNQAVYSLGDLELDLVLRKVTLRKEILHLTPLEYNLLVLFFKHMGQVLRTQFILDQIYGKFYGSDTQALRKLMAGLRRKIEDVPGKPRYIITEIGIGYRLVDQ